MSNDFIPKEIRENLKFEYDKGQDAAAEVRVHFVPLPKQCPDCDLVVTDRRTWFRHYDKPFSHWHELCKGCSLIKNPSTGRFEIKNADANKFIRSNPDLFKPDK